MIKKTYVMKRFCTLLAIDLASFSMALAQPHSLRESIIGGMNAPIVPHFQANATQQSAGMKAMPVASVEIISEAPAGKVVSNAVCKGYSYFYDKAMSPAATMIHL